MTFQMSASGLKDRAEGLSCYAEVFLATGHTGKTHLWLGKPACHWDEGQDGFHYLLPFFYSSPRQRLSVSNTKHSGGAYMAKQSPPLILSNKSSWNVRHSNVVLLCTVPVAPGTLAAQLLQVF